MMKIIMLNHEIWKNLETSCLKKDDATQCNFLQVQLMPLGPLTLAVCVPHAEPRWPPAAGGCGDQRHLAALHGKAPSLHFVSIQGHVAPHFLTHLHNAGTTTHGFCVFQNGHDHLLAIMHERKVACLL